MLYLEQNSDIISLIKRETLLEALDKNFWQEEMAQNFSNIQQILNSKKELLKFMKKSKIKTFTLELFYLLICEENANPDYNSNQLREEIVSKMLSSYKYINIIGIISFLDGMREDSIKYIAETILSEKELTSCEYKYRDNLKIDISSLALLIFSKNPDHLHMLEASEIIMNRKFEDYVMVENVSDDDINVNRDRLDEVLTEGIDYKKIDGDYISEIISKVETKYNNFDSRFIGSFTRNENLFVILFREYKEGKLRTLEEAIIANEAEIVTLRFNKNLKQYSIIAHDNNIDFAVDIGNYIISDKGIENVKYIQASEYVYEENIKKLLRVLQDDSLPNMQLYEVCLKNTPLTSSPLLILRSHKKKQNLGLAIEEFQEEHNFNILKDNINLIKWIKLSYKLPDKKDDSFSIIKLNLDKKESNKYVVTHSMSQMNILKRNVFKRTLDQNYDVVIYGG